MICILHKIINFHSEPQQPKLKYDKMYRDILSLNAGQSLHIPIAVSGIPKPTVTWGKDDTPFKHTAHTSMEKTDKGVTIDGLYFVLAQNSAGEEKVTFEVENLGI